MPEYLAPGVYVEETSFRARSIEGVSTSTSGFAGPARKGPVSGTPSLVTSFPEFVRLFGGLADLDLTGTQETTNYLAHSVRAYFNEGGSRLYVARVFSGTPASATAGADVIPNADANLRARFTARFPGRVGNGSISVREVLAPATVGAMRRAPTGSLVRLNQTAASAARVVGTLPPPFDIPDGTTLTLTFDGTTDVTLTFSGRNAEAAATEELDPTTTFLEANQTLTVTLGGQAQTLTLPIDTPLTPAEVVDALNRQLRGGYARLSGADDAAPVGRLILGTDARGRHHACAASLGEQDRGAVERQQAPQLAHEGGKRPLEVERRAECARCAIGRLEQVDSAAELVAEALRFRGPFLGVVCLASLHVDEPTHDRAEGHGDDDPEHERVVPDGNVELRLPPEIEDEQDRERERACDQPAGKAEEERRLQHDQELERPQGLGGLPREREHQGGRDREVRDDAQRREVAKPPPPAI